MDRVKSAGPSAATFEVDNGVLNDAETALLSPLVALAH
jgi:hypothetical protein